MSRRLHWEPEPICLFLIRRERTRRDSTECRLLNEKSKRPPAETAACTRLQLTEKSSDSTCVSLAYAPAMKSERHWYWRSIAMLLTVGALPATAAVESTTRVWDVTTGQSITNSPASGGGLSQLAAFSLDGQLLATMSSDGTARVWDLTTSRGSARRSSLEHNWTFRWRGTRYGFARFGPVGSWPRSTFVVWNSKAYRIPVPPARLFVFCASVLALIAAVAYWWFVPHRGSGKHGFSCTDRAT